MIASRIAPSEHASEELVSVIIPVYQGERLILGAVQSALGQTHSALEVIVVDDGSSDATLQRLATVDDSRLQVLCQKNSGVGAARNAALARARGRYIAFLDSDDRWFPDKIATELELLRHAPPGGAIAYSSHFAVDDRGALLHSPPVHGESGDAFDLMLDGEDFLMPSLCLFDRRIFDAVGTFEPGCYHEDHDFIIRATRRFPIYATGRLLAVNRQTTSGRCRAILSNYDAALNAEVSLVDALAHSLSACQAARLRENVVRSLYLRFLTYGFNAHARRLRRELELARLPRGLKGRLGWFFAKTGLNLVAPARMTVQALTKSTRQGWWRRTLAASGLELRYE